MAFQPSDPACIEVAIHFLLFGIPLVVVITVCLDSGGLAGLTDVTNAANAVDAWMHNDVMPNLSDDLSYTGVTATGLATDTSPQFSVNRDPVIAGGQAAIALPSQIAIVTTYYTALRGRSFRGRSFWPGVPSTYQLANTNIITTTGQGNIVGAVANLPTHLIPFSLHHAVLSRRHGGVKRLIASAQPVTSYAINDTFDTQRRRGSNAHRS